MPNALDLIEDGVLEGQPLSSLLQKVIILSGQVNSPPLRQWATDELNGYKPQDDLPDYRYTNPGLKFRATYVHGGVDIRHIGPIAAKQLLDQYFPTLPGVPLSEFQRCGVRAAISEIEMLGQKDTTTAYSPNYAEPLGTAIQGSASQQGSFGIAGVEVYFELLPTQLAGIANRVMTVLSSFVADLRVTTPREGGYPSAEAVNAAAQQNFQLHVTGNNNTINAAGGDQRSLKSTPQSPESQDRK